jgi:hypothetical protein
MERPGDVDRRRCVRLCRDVDHRRGGVPVQGEVLAMPLLGVAFLIVGAILLHVNPFSPLSEAPSPEPPRLTLSDARRGG